MTWTAEVARIVQARCVACHSPQGRAPMSLQTWQDARPWAKAIKEEVLTRRMPLWHAVRGYGDLANDPSLSPFEIALISAWADGGAPLGKGEETRKKEEGTRKKAEGETQDDEGITEITVPCGDKPLPRGVLLGVAPVADRGASVGMTVALPGGRREIVAWIRGYDPDFAVTYRLRRPLELPAGSRMIAELIEESDSADAPQGSSTRCSVRARIAARP
ncbi:MAG TPA: hypothetical protein VLD67_19735 [Vicinamibacterales bacterium]|nr:hypothetical protein [Vicinamibacterales bacterium]